mmetsp:Transcript_19120/g.48563  ORF Transcript_19120/g.48563 Transcript_19120/m.48563 type:complete len:233 (+) Transcript_19120:123-821(+)
MSSGTCTARACPDQDNGCTLFDLPESVILEICSNFNGSSVQHLHSTCTTMRHAALQHVRMVSLDLTADNAEDTARPKLGAAGADSSNAHAAVPHAAMRKTSAHAAGPRAVLQGPCKSSAFRKSRDCFLGADSFSWLGGGASDDEDAVQPATGDAELARFLPASSTTAGSVQVATVSCVSKASVLIRPRLHWPLGAVAHHSWHPCSCTAAGCTATSCQPWLLSRSGSCYSGPS